MRRFTAEKWSISVHDLRRHLRRHHDKQSDMSKLELTAKARACTNIYFLAMFVLLSLTLLVLTGYCMHFGDLDVMLKGYDDCGNLCGMVNKGIDNFTCSGKNHSSLVFQLLNVTKTADNRTKIKYGCVKSCPTKYEKFANRCFRRERGDKSLSEPVIIGGFLIVRLRWSNILTVGRLVGIITFGLGMLFIFGLRKVRWIVLAEVTTLVYILVLVMSWTALNNQRIDSRIIVHTLTISAAFLGAIPIIIVYLRKNGRLVRKLFLEATFAIFTIRPILFLPALTLLALRFISALLGYVSLWTLSVRYVSGDSKSPSYDLQNVSAWSTLINFVVHLWSMNFCIGCQEFVIARVVVEWYYAIDKYNEFQFWTIVRSIGRLSRYHLGSVACGAFINTVSSLIQMTLYSYVQYFLDLESVVKYITQSAYIIITIHGQNYFASAIRAFNNIWINKSKHLAVFFLAAYALHLTKWTSLFVSLPCADFMLQDNYWWTPVIIAALPAFLLAEYALIVNVIFLSYCEAMNENNDKFKSFYMCPGLAKFVDTLYKKIYGAEDIGAKKIEHEPV